VSDYHVLLDFTVEHVELGTFGRGVLLTNNWIRLPDGSWRYIPVQIALPTLWNPCGVVAVQS
jgi:hypothetical protein